MSLDLGNMLQQYLGGNQQADTRRTAEDYDRATQAAPREAVAEGVTGAFRSDQTPPFPQMISQMFGQSDPNQRAGMLNQLLASVGPHLLSGLAGGSLGNLLGGGQQPARVTPEQASQVSPDEVQQLAERAERENPGIIDRMGDFYADHPGLVKAIGGAALSVALSHMAQGARRH